MEDIVAATFWAGGICVVFGLIVLLSKGRAANWVAGYNTMAPAKKARLDPQKVSRHAGITMLVSAGFLLLSGCVYLVFTQGWLIVAGWVIFVVIGVSGTIWSNIGPKLLKDEYKNLCL